MPFAERGGVRIHYRLDGRADAPVLVLSHSLGCDLAMWDGVVPRLQEAFRLLRFDMRGHGASDAPDGDYTMAQLGGDVLAVMDAAGVTRADFCGLSLGGMVGQWLAVHAPARLGRFVLANTARVLPREPWGARAQAVRAGGMAAVAELVMGRFFAAGGSAEVRDTVRATLLATDPAGYAGCCAAIRDMDLSGAIAAPVLVVNGSADIATPPERGEAIAASIPGARTALLSAAHLSAVELPGAFAAAVLEFLVPLPEDRYERGLAVRRRVLGDAWVDRSLAAATPFSADFQAFITRVAWGEVWTRPGLDHRTRRLLVLATTVALGRWEEFRLHVRAGLEQGGFTVNELREVILQAAVYAGVPAANTAMAEAGEILREFS